MDVDYLRSLEEKGCDEIDDYCERADLNADDVVDDKDEKLLCDKITEGGYDNRCPEVVTDYCPALAPSVSEEFSQVDESFYFILKNNKIYRYNLLSDNKYINLYLEKTGEKGIGYTEIYYIIKEEIDNWFDSDVGSIRTGKIVFDIDKISSDIAKENARILKGYTFYPSSNEFRKNSP